MSTSFSACMRAARVPAASTAAAPAATTGTTSPPRRPGSSPRRSSAGAPSGRVSVTTLAPSPATSSAMPSPAPAASTTSGCIPTIRSRATSAARSRCSRGERAATPLGCTTMTLPAKRRIQGMASIRVRTVLRCFTVIGILQDTSGWAVAAVWTARGPEAECAPG